MIPSNIILKEIFLPRSMFRTNKDIKNTFMSFFGMEKGIRLKGKY
jgi:hypothetical protein